MVFRILQTSGFFSEFRERSLVALPCVPRIGDHCQLGQLPGLGTPVDHSERVTWGIRTRCEGVVEGV